MIAAIRIAVDVWAWGIPVAGLLLGLVIRSAPAHIRWHILKREYTLWCVAWPWTLCVLAYRMGRRK